MSFTFIPETHTYVRADGRAVPSVTQCLDACGIVDYSGIPQPVLEHKKEIGTAAHAACHYDDEGDLNTDTVADEVLPYLLAWRKFRLESKFEPRLVEQRGIASENGMEYGYTLDREGAFAGVDTVIEIKCTANVEISWGPQTAAYEMALRRIDGKIRQRIAVHLKPNGNYSLLQLKDVNDYRVFMWALGMETWKRRKGRINHGNDSNHND